MSNVARGYKKVASNLNLSLANAVTTVDLNGLVNDHASAMNAKAPFRIR
jgi:hypothetical protein